MKRNKTDAADAAALLEQRIAQLEQEFAALVKQSPACKELLTVPGIGLLTDLAPILRTPG